MMNKRELKKNKSSLFLLFLVVFIDLVGFGIVIPILPYYARAYGANASTLGWLMASYSILQFFFAPAWGKLSDHIGRRPVLLATILGTGIGFLWLGFADSLLGLFVGRCIAGICGANISTANAYIVDITTEENRTKGMGLLGAAFGLGFIFGPAIGGILSHYGYSTPVLLAAFLSLFNFIFAYFYLPEPLKNSAVREQNRFKRFDLEGLSLVLREPLLRRGILVFFFTTLAITQMETSFAIYLWDIWGWDAHRAGLLLAGIGIVMVFIQGGAIGKLSKSFGETKLILFGTLLSAGGLCLFGLSTIPAVMLLSLLLMAIGNGVTNPSLSSMTSQAAPAHLKGMSMGFYQSAGSLARIFGPILAGYLYDYWGRSYPFFSGSVFLVVAFFFFSIQAKFSRSGRTIKSLFRGILHTFRESGFKGVVKRYGWKLVAAIFLYYLIRDLTLYVLIPTLIVRKIINF